MIGRLGQVLCWGLRGVIGALFIFAGGTYLFGLFVGDGTNPGLAGTLLLYSTLAQLADAPNGGAILVGTVVIIGAVVAWLSVRACFYVIARR